MVNRVIGWIDFSGLSVRKIGGKLDILIRVGLWPEKIMKLFFAEIFNESIFD